LWRNPLLTKVRWSLVFSFAFFLSFTGFGRVEGGDDNDDWPAPGFITTPFLRCASLGALCWRPLHPSSDERLHSHSLGGCGGGRTMVAARK
jgi:hypothetical protein